VQHEGNRLICYPQQMIIAGHLPAMDINTRELGIVVEHFFEVGH
jgi:hypothetical protein